MPNWTWVLLGTCILVVFLFLVSLFIWLRSTDEFTSRSGFEVTKAPEDFTSVSRFTISKEVKKPLPTPFLPNKLDFPNISLLHQKKVHLAKAIEQYFNQSELRTFCYDLGVEYDNLRGETHSEKSRDFVDQMVSRGRFADLVWECKKKRPNVIWEPQVDYGPAGREEE